MKKGILETLSGVCSAGAFLGLQFGVGIPLWGSAIAATATYVGFKLALGEAKKAPDPSQVPQHAKALENARAASTQLGQLVNRCPNAKVAEQLKGMQASLHQLIERLVADPDLVSVVDLFINLQLPDVLRLVHQYVDLVCHPAHGRFADSTRQMEAIIGRVQGKFEEQVDRLIRRDLVKLDLAGEKVVQLFNIDLEYETAAEQENK
ncbi:MAG: 5-bromo-4-chloroindolyl phosphate hydrolysis family protein [Acidobacteria bacterium]|nr:5-bromo-4-chloroindolyl phosphate hydrolysis family protein [Acidobacteriota bacterium]MCB9398486.1 5-bromo-4-chloroindolyl phosphate hydrolysis family protein [Acidobacteriota bacterium]